MPKFQFESGCLVLFFQRALHCGRRQCLWPRTRCPRVREERKGTGNSRLALSNGKLFWQIHSGGRGLWRSSNLAICSRHNATTAGSSGPNPVLIFITPIKETEDFLKQPFTTCVVKVFYIRVLSRTPWSSMTPLLGFLHTGMDHSLFSNPISRDCLSLLQLEDQAPLVSKRASSQPPFPHLCSSTACWPPAAAPSLAHRDASSAQTCKKGASGAPCSLRSHSWVLSVARAPTLQLLSLLLSKRRRWKDS